MSIPKVSVIVPVYNVEKYLKYCMDSLLNQTLTDIEIILVDDGSPDRCPEICDEYAEKDRVKVIHKKNEGLGYARNSGLEIATGEYIAFVDSDDYIETVTYQKLYSIAEETHADVVYFSFQRINNQGHTWQDTSKNENKTYHSEKEIQGLMLDMIANPPKAKLDRNIECSACCSLYRNEIIRKHGLRFKNERELISEDLLFNVDYLLHTSKVITISDALYYYRVNQSSLTRTVRSDRIEKNYYFYQYLLKILCTNHIGNEGFLRATRLFIGYSRKSIRQYTQSSLLSKREKQQWLKGVTKHPVWHEIASSYPYRQLPFMYALHFYLLHKGCCLLLYYYSKLKYGRMYLGAFLAINSNNTSLLSILN